MRYLAVSAALVAVFAAACSNKPEVPVLPDYTVIAKAVYLSGSGSGAGKFGRYVTVVIGGVESETLVKDSETISGSPCWDNAKLGVVLPPECR